MTKNLHFIGKKCWITGGGSGIGSALALQLAELGAEVYISGRNSKKISAVSSQHPNIYAIVLDVTNKESWANATEVIRQTSSQLDYIIFNAGMCKYIDLPVFQAETFREVMDVNFMGVVNGLEVVLPLLRKAENSHIVAVTSSVARLPLPRAEAYGASKAAVTYLMNSLRLGLIDDNIDVSVVLPGFVDTPMTAVNDFPMPFMVSPKSAAKSIIKGLIKRRQEIYFPSRFTWPLRFLASLPIFIQSQFTKRLVRS